MAVVQSIQFKRNNIRYINEYGTLFFVAKDITFALGYKDGKQLIKRYLKPEQRLKRSIPTNSGQREAVVITDKTVLEWAKRSTRQQSDCFYTWFIHWLSSRNTVDNGRKALVTINNRTPTTSSLVISEFLGKKHKHVLRDIDNLIKKMSENRKHLLSENVESKFETIKNLLPSFDDANYQSIEKHLINISECFVETVYFDKNKRPRRQFLINRDGFFLLVMEYSGTDALLMKEIFISEFNRMERYIQSQYYI